MADPWLSRRSCALILCLSALAGTFAGCGKSAFPTAPVSGRLTLNGKPVAGVHVSFQPVAASPSAARAGEGSVGVTDEEGRYELRLIDSDRPGAVVARHVVRLVAKELRENSAGDAGSPAANPLPPSSLDGSLSFEVPPGGTDQANFDLKTAR